MPSPPAAPLLRGKRGRLRISCARARAKTLAAGREFARVLRALSTIRPLVKIAVRCCRRGELGNNLATKQTVKSRGRADQHHGRCLCNDRVNAIGETGVYFRAYQSYSISGEKEKWSKRRARCPNEYRRQAILERVHDISRGTRNTFHIYTYIYNKCEWRRIMMKRDFVELLLEIEICGN